MATLGTSLGGTEERGEKGGRERGKDNEITVGRWNDYFLITRRQVGYYSIYHVEPEEVSSTTGGSRMAGRR